MLKAKLLGATAGAEEALAIEDVFSTYLYTGGTAQQINNGIDLDTEGGMVWIKRRNSTFAHQIFDTQRTSATYGTPTRLSTNTTSAADVYFTTGEFSWLADGFDLNNTDGGVNGSGGTYASWTFRQAPRFFDVVTYTGTGANRTIAHDLGVVPGCILVKRTNTTGDWQVYHRSNANTEYMVLNSTAAKATGATRWNSTTPTSSVFSLGTDATVNASGSTYVAYLFAHDPLGPSGDGSDGLIACGSYVGTGAAGNFQNLGWEPQYVLVKGASTAGYNWNIHDVMRGMSESQSYTLKAESSEAENLDTPGRLLPRPTGFEFSDSGLAANNASGVTYTYIAIRRGPMREPTVGTEVFDVDYGLNVTTSGQKVFDSAITADALLYLLPGSGGQYLYDRMRGGDNVLQTSSTNAESSGGFPMFDTQTGVNSDTVFNFTARVGAVFRRAPGFFDVVAYRGTGTFSTPVAHNLKVAPELIINKARTTTGQMNWYVGHYGINKYTQMTNTYSWQPNLSTYSPVTESTFVPMLDASSASFIAYLFASLPGISKVGSYTGNGSSQTINCAFTTGARFVLINRTDSPSDWYVWDTARGIVSGNDPHLSLNTTAAEVTSDDTIDPDNSGFIVNQVAATNVNVNAASYIFYAVS